MDVRAKLSELGLELPETPRPVAEYVPAVRTGNLVYVSGMLPMKAGSLTHEGRVPEDVDVDGARAAARQAVLNGLAAIAMALDGDWTRFVRVVRLGVFVNNDAGFQLQHKVANGASELLVQVFGEAGRHVRAAVGAHGLPVNAPVEVELLVEVK